MKKTTLIFLFLLISTWINLPNAKEKQITFAMEATYPPFESIDEKGQIIGFDIEVGQAICKKIRATCRFVNAPWDSLIPGLKLGKYDALISAIAITPERAKQVAFSQPYYFDTASFVTKKNQTIDFSLEGLKNKRVGVQGGTSMERYMQNTYTDNHIHIIRYASIADAFLDLRSGRLDAVLADTPIANDWISKLARLHMPLHSKLVADNTYFGGGLGIAVNKANSELLKDIDQAINDLKTEGTYEHMFAIYFGKTP